MGFGHRVYRTGDSRVPTMKHYMFKVAKLLKSSIVKKRKIDEKKILNVLRLSELVSEVRNVVK